MYIVSLGRAAFGLRPIGLLIVKPSMAEPHNIGVIINIIDNNIIDIISDNIVLLLSLSMT